VNQEELRSLVTKYHTAHKQEISESLERELAGMIKTSDIRCEESARGGQGEVVVFTIPSYREDLISIPENCQYSLIDDTEEVIERARRNLNHIGTSCLSGNAAALRDYLVAKGLGLYLRMRIVGNTCNSSHYVWDIIARW